MTWQINDREFQQVLMQPGTIRYKYFISHVADWKEVWSLRNQEGWIQAQDHKGTILFPVWPHPRYAQACASGPWEDCRPEVIDLDARLNRWIPGMKRDNRWIAVFPTPQSVAICVSPERLEPDLKAELARLVE